jgi:hypothetical protein
MYTFHSVQKCDLDSRQKVPATRSFARRLHIPYFINIHFICSELYGGVVTLRVMCQLSPLGCYKSELFNQEVYEHVYRSGYMSRGTVHIGVVLSAQNAATLSTLPRIYILVQYMLTLHTSKR